jgi:diaminohydroxyphosphoribosylaminopyrimidine deaminase / 5-amino-6-(5-phosphoribosylamino)uracil reductase
MADVDRWEAAMREALALAQSPDAPYGENPRVGCVLVDAEGEVVGRGFHRGAGTPHAEVDAIRDAGGRAAGATAVVTLEPCRHVGRTGPCTEALLAAGVRQVVFAQADPSDDAGGGADVLRAAGLEVSGGLLAAQAEQVNEAWTFAVRHGRPMVTWKAAVSMDGRVAGADGGPTRITGEAARAQVHELRAQVGAVIVGTGTVLVDDPELTVRIPGRDATRQPLRVVMGRRQVPAGARVRDSAARTLLVAERDPAAVLGDLYSRGVRHALLEGGPTLASAFLSAGLVDRVDWYVAPLLLGAGPVALPPSTVPGRARATGVDVEEVSVVGEDVRIVGRVRYERSEA